MWLWFFVVVFCLCELFFSWVVWNVGCLFVVVRLVYCCYFKIFGYMWWLLWFFGLIVIVWMVVFCMDVDFWMCLVDSCYLVLCGLGWWLILLWLSGCLWVVDRLVVCWCWFWCGRLCSCLCRFFCFGWIVCCWIVLMVCIVCFLVF